MTTVKDGTQKGIKLTYGDYVHFGDGEIYQVRGNGNCPQLYKVEKRTVAIGRTVDGQLVVETA